MTDGEVAQLRARIDEQDAVIQKLIAGLCETTKIVRMMAEKVRAQHAAVHNLDRAMHIVVAVLTRQTPPPRVVATTTGTRA